MILVCALCVAAAVCLIAVKRVSVEQTAGTVGVEPRHPTPTAYPLSHVRIVPKP